MKPYVKEGWAPVNTSGSPDPETHKLWFDKTIKPDLALYESARPRNATLCQASEMECFGEFKISDHDEPFRVFSEEQSKSATTERNENQRESTPQRDMTSERDRIPVSRATLTTPFECETSDARDTRGQMALYINAIQATQQRTRVFAFYVRKQYCRLLCHSRSCTLVTPLIDFTTTSDLQTFFWRLTHADKAARGFDTTFEPIGVGDPNAVPARSRLELENTDPLFRVSVTDLSSDNNVKYYYVSEPMTSSHTYPVGRGTRCFKAYDPEQDGLVLLKDTWRFASHMPEHEIYATLHASQVPNIPTVLAAGDVPGDLQQCGGDDIANTSLCPVPEPQKHYRLVLREVGRPLSRFYSTYELISVIYDAFQGMHLLYFALFY